MNFGILRPYILLLIPILIAFLLFSSKYMGKMIKARKRTILIVRSIVLILLILCMAGISIRWTVKETSTVFVVDCSDSMKEYNSEIEVFIKEALKQKDKKDKYGIVTFGDNALIENFISDKTAFDNIETEPGGIYTDIENAINTAISILPSNTKKRIVLITDGEENKGVSFKASHSLNEHEIDFKIYKIAKEEGEEVSVHNIVIPQSLSEGEEFNIIVNLNSTVNTEVDLSIFADNKKSLSEKVKVVKGENTFVFKDKALRGGFKSYKVFIESEIDKELKNNEASAFTNIKSKPRILVIEDEEGKADELVKILRGSNIDFTKINAKNAPKSLENLSLYKTIITCDVSAENLDKRFLDNLEIYVRELGGGFIASGGRTSFALGGYIKTPLEKVLPVHMDMKGKKEIPSMAMVLIIDKSGSMGADALGYNKMDLAKEAAVRTLDSLRPNKDEIGVLAFDGRNYWVVDRNIIENKEDIKNNIGTLRAEGGTSILPALNEGLESLKSSKAGIKHVILLTDGQAERAGYNPLIKEFNNEGITVSTVAVGSGADTTLLKSIADGAKGRFYFTEDSSSIPKIFAKETYMVTRAYINNREFTPVINGYHPILSGAAEDGLPNLLGYIGASPKDTAKVLLKSDEDDPILTVWQYGLGKTAAWNSDIDGKWSANYVGWNNNFKLWQNIINYTIENYNDENGYVEVDVQGDKVVVTLNSKNIDEGTESNAAIITPTLETMDIKLLPTEPGKFSGEFQVKEKGVYLIKALQRNKDEIITAVNSGAAIQYSPEYRIKPKNSTLDSLIKETDAEYITISNEVFKGEIEDIKGRTDITTILLIIALILFVIDIALRRLNLPYNKIKNKFSNIIKTISEKLNEFSSKEIKRNDNDFTESMKKAVKRSSKHNNEVSDTKGKKEILTEEKESNKENKKKYKGINEKEKFSNKRNADKLDTKSLLQIKNMKRKK